MIKTTKTNKTLALFAVLCALASGQNTGRITLIPNAADSATGEARLAELKANGTNYVGFKAPSSIGANRIWTLPSADGSSNQALVTDGAGVLSWSGALTGYWTRTGTRVYPSTVTDTVVLGTSATAGSGELYLYDESSAAGSQATTVTVRAGADQNSVSDLVYFRDSAGAEIAGVNASGDFFQTEGANRTIGFNQYALSFASDRGFGWTSTSNYFNTTDTEIIRGSAGRVRITKNDKTATGDLTAAAVAVEADLTASGHILATTTGTKDIGSSSNYWQTIYAKNIDAAPSGVLSNYVKARKLEVADANGGTSFWDVQSVANGTVASNFYVRDNAGNTILDLVRRVASADVDEGRLRLHWVPAATATWDLGTSGVKWRDAYMSGTLNVGTAQIVGSTGNITGAVINATGSPAYRVNGTTVVDASRNGSFVGLTAAGASTLTGNVDLGGDVTLATNEGTDIGTTSSRLNAVYSRRYEANDGTHARIVLNNPGAGSNAGSAVSILNASGASQFSVTYSGTTTVSNLTVSGTCTGCGGSLFTDGGATTYLTATGDNLAIGTTSTSYKFEVSGGASKFGGSLEFATDNAYNVGATSVRPATAYLRAVNLAGDVTPNTDNSHALGSTSARLAAVYSGTGFRVHTSGVDRFEALNTGVNVRSSGGTLNFSVTASSGDVDTQGVYKKGGTSGITASGSTCTITAISGGIITGGSCI